MQQSAVRLSDFDYILPPELISYHPPKDRPSAKLLAVSRKTGEWEHKTFRDIVNYFKSGDVLVLNNTKVRPSRIFGKKESGGKAEALLLKETGPDEWKVLLRPGARIKKGAMLEFSEGGTSLKAEVMSDSTPGSAERILKFSGGGVKEKLAAIGHMPLPPYIDRPDTPQDREDYQTVFAEKEGAVASPTAGLHFDEALLKEIEQKGVEIVYVTLHTGYGTFQSISEEDLAKHKMFSEEYEVTGEAAASINRALKEKRRIIACGTTSVRTVESAAGPDGLLKAGRGETNLFVYPPYEFKAVGAMITNFHLPKSSLLLLVGAFLGVDKMFRAYDEAIKRGYKFYSYGDAMFVS